MFSSEFIGSQNAAMINNLTVDIVNNSLGNDCITLSNQAFNDLKIAKKENYEYIYRNEKIESKYNEIIKPMFSELYYKLLDDVINQNINSFIYKHHINAIQKSCLYYDDWDYASEEPNQIVVDFIASMTDDYFIDLYRLLFSDSSKSIKYHSYFEDS